MISGRIYVTESQIICGSRDGAANVLYPISTGESIPSGIITMWSGASNAIPAGWFLCDGDNNTPDLRNRFIVGAGDKYGVGDTGGSENVTLITNQIPAHSHGHTFRVSMSGMSCSRAGDHVHSLNNIAVTAKIPYNSSSSSMDGGARNGSSATTSSSGGHTHTITGSGSLSGSISNAGGGQSHENRPPYYALCFIMKA